MNIFISVLAILILCANMAFINYHGKQSDWIKLFYDIAFIMHRRNGEVGVYFNEGWMN